MDKIEKEIPSIQDMEQQNQNYLNSESNILVSIRVRPLNQKEILVGDFDIVRVEDKLIVTSSNNFLRVFIPWHFRLFLTP